LHLRQNGKKKTINYSFFFLFSVLVVFSGGLIITSSSCQKTREKVSMEKEIKPPNPLPKVTNNDYGKPQLILPRVFVTIKPVKGKTITIEAQVASSLAEQSKGLMYRKFLPQDEGMLFIYNQEDNLGFYMANCFISLDMIFMNSKNIVVGIIEKAVPFDSTTRSIGKPSQYVLEVNGGFSSRHGITPGAKISWKDGNR
jgi:uncharacterized protein